MHDLQVFVTAALLRIRGSGVIRITAGAGDLLANSDPEDPTYTALTWAQTDLDLSASDDVYYVYVNSSGTVTTQLTEPTPADYRQKAFLHRVSIRSGVVSGTASIVTPLQQYGPQIGDILDALGSVKAGQVLSANGANLSMDISAGSLYQRGLNFYTNAEDPHRLAISAQSPVTFRHVEADGTQTTDRTTFDVGNYDNAGTITAIPGNSSRAQIFTCYAFPSSSNYRFFYGQEFYSNVAEAEQALREGLHNPTVPAAYENAVLLGWVIASKSETDLSSGGVFVTSNRFGLLGGAISTAGSGGFWVLIICLMLTNAATALANLGGAPRTVEINAQTGTTYTGVLGDDGKKITMSNASANTFTIPTNASVAYPVGTILSVTQLGAGITTIEGDTGVTLNGVVAGSGAINDQYSGVTLLKIATDTWIAEGNIETVA